MYSAKDAVALIDGVLKRSIPRVKAALAAGADVDGSPGQHFTPLMLATISGNNAGMVSFLIENNADPEIPAGIEISPKNADSDVLPGERALHLAVKSGSVEVASLLLKRARADPNAADRKGHTPLMVACMYGRNCVELVRLLLEAGANPASAEENGCTPLYLAARQGLPDVVDMLHTAAPGMLNEYTTEENMTPLTLACINGNESTVSRLLSLGATEQMPLDQASKCPLAQAVLYGHVGVVRILIKEGLGMVGGFEALPRGLLCALLGHHAKILQLLLVAGGKEAPTIDWKIFVINRTKSLIHRGAAYCCPASVSVLLRAGADEMKLDSKGRLPQDMIGIDCGRKEIPRDGGKEVAILRMLKQGPAYRARSWAWPADGVGANGCGDGVAGAILLSPPATPKAPVGVRTFRPKSDGKFFVSLAGRHCEKG